MAKPLKATSIRLRFKVGDQWHELKGGDFTTAFEPPGYTAPATATCPDCKGRGRIPLLTSVAGCERCDGTGEVVA